MERWARLEEFPDFAISSEGTVKNLKTGKIRKPLYYNSPAITLTRADGRSTQRSIAGLVSNAFGIGTASKE